MKKILLISLVATMMMSFTACMKKEEVKDEVIFKSYIEDTFPERVTTEETTEETTTEETEVVTEETTEEISQGDTKIEEFATNGCKIKIDELKWLDVKGYLELSKMTSENPEAAIALEQKMKATCDAAYYYKSLSGANLTIASMEVGEAASQMDLSDNIIAGMLASNLEKELTQSGVTFVGAEMEKFNGNPSLVITIESPAIMTGTVDMKAQMCIFYEGTHQYAVTFTAEKENFDKYKPDFDEVVDSITFN